MHWLRLVAHTARSCVVVIETLAVVGVVLVMVGGTTELGAASSLLRSSWSSWLKGSLHTMHWLQLVAHTARSCVVVVCEVPC
jgi:hypothetical protein